MVERLGVIGDARHMDGMVGPKKKKKLSFQALTLNLCLQGNGFVYNRYSFFCMADWVSF